MKNSNVSNYTKWQIV